MTLADQAAMVNPMTGNCDVIIIGSGAGGGTGSAR
jgi:choline dehydrogenase-like flavoprotein